MTVKFYFCDTFWYPDNDEERHMNNCLTKQLSFSPSKYDTVIFNKAEILELYKTNHEAFSIHQSEDIQLLEKSEFARVILDVDDVIFDTQNDTIYVLSNFKINF